ncbi:DUF1236 domain-containing protein [Bosea sp. Root483D1]|uniref:DUF1236 domain-containing protein n=1 Tax=Bosea sp. Root483D1 TaxID=1736544 RepID=UPI0009E86222|nr:DUF1236 domain-containing protein [Bosea sp. Root483D1]
MKQFAGIATIAIMAHAGVAWAQPVIIGPGEGPVPVERPTREAPVRALEPERGPAQRMHSPGPERRDIQPSQDPQRGQIQRRERDQAQRERSDQAPNPRAQQEQRRDEKQQRDQAQRERQDDRNGRRSSDQPQPDNRTPRSPETAQPQRPENRSGTPSTAQPAPKQDDQQRPAANAQRPDATQPGATSSQPAQNRTSPGGQGSDTAQAGAADNQRIADTVRQRVERNEVRPVQSLGVSVSVGAELPSRVQLQPLPSEIAAIRPQYRDYRYTVSEREIVIVDPRSRRIVEVIDRGGGGGGSVDIYAAFEHRRDVRRWHRPDTVVFREGVVLPVGVPYYDLPDEVIERHPDWRGYQYVMTESEEVAIVEPRTRRIIEVVDKNAPRSAAAVPANTRATASPAPSNGTTDRHELARMILADARPGEIQGVDGLKGAVLPAQVALRPLPAEVEQQDQQLRGFHYALIGDDVLIVDPKSREIVDVIE